MRDVHRLARTRRGSWRPPRGDEAGGARRCGRAPSRARTGRSRRPQRRRKWRHRGRSRRPEPRSREPASLATVPSSRIGGQGRGPAVGSAAETLVSGGGGRRRGRGRSRGLEHAPCGDVARYHLITPEPAGARSCPGRKPPSSPCYRGGAEPQGPAGRPHAGRRSREGRALACRARLALTGREPVSPRIIGRGDVTGPRGRSLWGQVPDTPQVCATPQPRPAAPPSLLRAVTFLLLLLDPDTRLARHLLAGPSRAPKRQGPPPTGARF